MNLHEYQAKELFRKYGIPTAQGQVSTSIDEALKAAEELGTSNWVVKAQVHAGGRGKAGGVKKVASLEELKKVASELLGTRLVTAQTDETGQPVNQVLIESPCDIQQEFYISMLIDRAHERVILMCSSAGGMDIEQVAQETPEKILTLSIHLAAGIQAHHSRRVAFFLGIPTHLKQLSVILYGMYRLFIENDLSLIEINPLVVTSEQLLALDAKITVDENALYRHQALSELRDASQEDPTEFKAHQLGLNYVRMDGNIGCMVNGAGLAMATMDIIKLHGGEPANFLDVGGGTTADRVAEAFKLILTDKKVKAIFVNIFGGIVRCDLIAQGIIQAVKEVSISIPVIVRLEGTNVEQGRALLAESSLAIEAIEGLTEAAQSVVSAAARD